MSTFLGYTLSWLEEHNAIHTAQEISRQPKLWRELANILASAESDLNAFLAPLLNKRNLRIILTGAGTSAFVGDAAKPFIQIDSGFRVESIPTTDLVSNPSQFLYPGQPTLLVSFARSGNSPESVAAVELVDQLVDESYHLFLTCNGEGALSQHANVAENAFCQLMPTKSNDKSFAMTSSFTCMLMSTLVLFGKMPIREATHSIETIAALCEEKLLPWNEATKQLAQMPYSRLITLGSGGFAGLAREASLKSLELSAGQVMASFDSSLGFRHGPKFAINNRALVVQYLSSEAYTRQYDLDLYHEIRRDNQALQHVALSEGAMEGELVFELSQLNLGDSWLCFPYILFSQMLAFEKSLALGLGPDNPCPTGEVNRVVQGVTIHPYQP